MHSLGGFHACSNTHTDIANRATKSGITPCHFTPNPLSSREEKRKSNLHYSVPSLPSSDCTLCLDSDRYRVRICVSAFCLASSVRVCVQSC